MEDRADTCLGTSAGAGGWGQTLVHERNLSTHCTVRDTDVLEAMPLYYTTRWGRSGTDTPASASPTSCRSEVTRSHKRPPPVTGPLHLPPSSSRYHPPPSILPTAASELSLSYRLLSQHITAPWNTPLLALSPLYPLSPTI